MLDEETVSANAEKAEVPTAPKWMYRRGLFRFGIWRRFVRRTEATLFYAWWRWGDKW